MIRNQINQGTFNNDIYNSEEIRIKQNTIGTLQDIINKPHAHGTNVIYAKIVKQQVICLRRK